MILSNMESTSQYASSLSFSLLPSAHSLNYFTLPKKAGFLIALYSIRLVERVNFKLPKFSSFFSYCLFLRDHFFRILNEEFANLLDVTLGEPLPFAIALSSFQGIPVVERNYFWDTRLIIHIKDIIILASWEEVITKVVPFAQLSYPRAHPR
jgi:hypothetical protein